MPQDAHTLTMVDLSVQVAKLDTVYRDVYLRRARQLLSPTFDEFAYRAIGSTEKEIADLMGRSRAAVLHRDWAQAAEISARIDTLREGLATMGSSLASGRKSTTLTRSPLTLFHRENTWDRMRRQVKRTYAPS